MIEKDKAKRLMLNSQTVICLAYQVQEFVLHERLPGMKRLQQQSWEGRANGAVFSRAVIAMEHIADDLGLSMAWDDGQVHSQDVQIKSLVDSNRVLIDQRQQAEVLAQNALSARHDLARAALGDLMDIRNYVGELQSGPAREGVGDPDLAAISNRLDALWGKLSSINEGMDIPF